MASKSLWAKIGLAKPEHRAWAMYDWANSAFMTVVISALFPPFFIRYAAGNSCTNADTFTQMMNATLTPFGPKFCAWAPQVPNATMYLGFGSAIALAICAFLSPALGAHIDHRPVRRKWLFAMTLIGCACAGMLALTERGDWLWAIAVFAVGQIAVNMAFVIYDGFLQHVAAPEELDRVSTAGYAIGYVGGGILLLINAVMILSPTTFGLANAGQATKASFISVGVWWLLFSIPFFRGVKEPPATPSATRVVWWKQVVTSARALHKYPHAFAMLVAFLVYNDGIGTMLRMSTAYGEEIGLAMGDMILALILVQFIGIPATFIFGAISRWVGTKRAILGGLVIYGCVTFAAYFITTAAHFYALAICIGLVQGGTQSLSRALFASMIPKDRSSEFFGVFAVFERFAGIFGPLTMGVAIAIFGGSRPAILSIGLFFVLGFWLLTRVDIEAGRAHAQQNAAGLSPHAMP